MLLETFNQNLPQIKDLFQILAQKKATISTAESCTGGILATMFTHFDGSSQFYLGGVTSYSNESKTNLLGVSRDIIKSHGAVSRETAAQMAEGVQERFGSEYSIAITGIAGPEGGSETKPIGTIWCGYATPGDVFTQKYEIDGDRAKIRSAIIALVLNDLKTYIVKGL
jgi:PncC family amidohydrolase